MPHVLSSSRRNHLSRRAFQLTVVACALSLALWLSQAFAVDEQSEPHIRIFQPGDNLIGWVGFATSSQDLFNQIPEAELVYTWDAEYSQYRFAARGYEASLPVIEPGMGLIVRIAGHDPVEWHQPTVANGEWVTLRPGPNLVAWTGPSGTPIDLAVGSIGDSFTHALYSNADTGELALYQAGLSPRTEPQHQLRRGDGLWIFSTTESTWLQPSGDRALYPLGPPPDHVRWYASFDKYLDADGLAFVATDNVADEALFRAAAILDEMLANRPDIREILIRRRVHTVVLGRTESVFDLTPYRQYRERVELEQFGDAGPRGIGPNDLTPTVIAEENLMCDGGSRRTGYDIAVHEFAHAIEYAISRGTRAGNFRIALAASYRSAQETGLWQGTHAMSKISEHWATGVQAWFGLAGEDYAGVSSRLDLIHYAPSLANLVRETIGEIDLNTTCHRAEATIQGSTRRRLLAVSVVDADGQTPDDLDLILRRASTGSTAARSTSWPDGSLNTLIEPGDYSLEVSIEGCKAYYANTGPTVNRESAGTFTVPDEDLSIQLQLPDGLCSYQATGTVLNADGDPVPIQHVTARGVAGTTKRGPSSDGGFSLRFPDTGQYSLRVGYRGCDYTFDGNDLVPATSKYRVIPAPQLAKHHLRLRLPENTCTGRISGRVVNSSGEPAVGTFVGLYNPWIATLTRVQGDGAFSTSVDLPGEHILIVSVPGCHVFYGANDFSTNVTEVTPFVMTDRDIQELEIRIPANVCDS